MRRIPTHVLLIASCSTVALLGGCRAVGPDYAGPPPAPAAPTFARAGDLAGAIPAAAPARWWAALGDPALDRLEERAWRANPNLDVARARLRQARAGLRGAHANALPNGTATALAAHARLPPAGPKPGGSGAGFQLPSSLNLYSVGFDATWEIDLFGGQRRATEAADASAQAAAANLADAQVSLAAEVAQAYVQLRATQARMALADAAIAREQRIVDLTRRRVQGGTASELDLARLQGQLEAARAEAEPLAAQLDADRDALAVLAGAAPGALDGELAAADPAGVDAVPLPPASVPVGDPAGLLRRRPDVRAAERLLAARTAQVGQSEAARFPHVTLLGLIGIGGTHLSDLARLDDYSAIAAPQLRWNVLDFGRNRARVDQAEGARAEAEAEYRAAVLDALRDAEDALARFRRGRTTLAAVARARAAAAQAAVLTQARQRAGTASVIDVLDTERQLLAADQNLAAARAALTADFIALQKALGLGWTDAAPAMAGPP